MHSFASHFSHVTHYINKKEDDHITQSLHTYLSINSNFHLKGIEYVRFKVYTINTNLVLDCVNEVIQGEHITGLPILVKQRPDVIWI